MATKMYLVSFFLAYLVNGIFGKGPPQTEPEKICDLECTQEPMELAFVIDASSSIYPLNYTDAKWFVSDFANVFEIGQENVRVAAVTYGSKVHRKDAFGFDAYSDKESLRAAINALPQKGGNTETGAAIQFMRERFLPTARPNVKKALVVLTDGNSQKQAVTAEQARITRESGVEIFAIGIGKDISEGELRNIAGNDDHVFSVTSYNLLGTLRSRLAIEICDEKVPDRVVCRDNPIDISLVIDASVSIGKTNFSIGQEFLKKFAASFDISPQRARFSAITYGRGTYDSTAFDFDSYTEEVGLVDAIASIPYAAGDYTDTGLGIEFMRTRQMLPKRRPHAVHIAVVLTDGQSQDWQKTAQEALITRNSDISVFAIGVGLRVSDKELLAIAGDQSSVFKVNDYLALDAIMEQLDLKACEIANASFGTSSSK